jgi:hypothetical protein
MYSRIVCQQTIIKHNRYSIRIFFCITFGRKIAGGIVEDDIILLSVQRAGRDQDLGLASGGEM